MQSDEARHVWKFRLATVSLAVTATFLLIAVARGRASLLGFFLFSLLSGLLLNFFNARRSGKLAELGAISVREGDEHARFTDAVLLVSTLFIAAVSVLMAFKQ